jgi:hypothetical protein
VWGRKQGGGATWGVGRVAHGCGDIHESKALVASKENKYVALWWLVWLEWDLLRVSQAEGVSAFHDTTGLAWFARK